MADGNGHYEKFAIDLKALADRQENLVTRAIEELKEVMHDGHNTIAEEIRKVREVGSLPIPLVKELLDHMTASNNKSMEYMTSSSDKNSDKIFKVVMAFLVVFLGVKAFFPHVLGN